jgi:hypothetical protein
LSTPAHQLQAGHYVHSQVDRRKSMVGAIEPPEETDSRWVRLVRVDTRATAANPQKKLGGDDQPKAGRNHRALAASKTSNLVAWMSSQLQAHQPYRAEQDQRESASKSSNRTFHQRPHLDAFSFFQ